MSDVLKGRRVEGKLRAPRQHGTGRRCESESCDTLLSQYNKRTYCYAHAPTRFPRLRGRVAPES